MTRRRLPRFEQVPPAGLATALDLARDGLLPGEGGPVALLRVTRPDFERLAGLYERAAARPKRRTLATGESFSGG